MFRIIVCHLLTLIIALQSLLAIVVAHPMEDAASHSHAASPHLIWSPDTHHTHERYDVKTDTSSFASDALTENCCHFHFGCGVCLSGMSLAFYFGAAPDIVVDEKTLLLPSHSSSLFRPPIA